ncbi:MAG TPA: hypothetical protein DCY13_19240 [Verrucomicrobiales bacterium]|nr:hypothetical protein [Verrucomicrobiales bacterium]
MITHQRHPGLAAVATAMGRPGVLPAGRATAGFTMIELMIVIGIMAVVMSISIPSFYRSLEKDTIRRATQVVLDASIEARSQAIITGQPHDLVILPGEGMLRPEPAVERVKTEEEMLLEEAEQFAAEMKAEQTGGVRKAVPGVLPEGIRIEFVGVNFVPDLQKLEEVRVRYYPNGTGDEFTMVIRSDQNEWRKFTLDVATALMKWEVLK